MKLPQFFSKHQTGYKTVSVSLSDAAEPFRRKVADFCNSRTIYRLTISPSADGLPINTFADAICM